MFVFERTAHICRFCLGHFILLETFELFGGIMDTFVSNRGLSHIANEIFANLNQKDIAKCRLVNDEWKHFIDDSKYIWRSIISQFDAKDCDDDKDCFTPWKQIVRNSKGFPIKDLKTLCKFLHKLIKLHRGTKLFGFYKVCCFDTFELACQFGSTKLCDLLLTYTKDYYIKRNALLVATEHKKTKIVKLILENYQRKVYISAKNSNLDTALHHACSNGNLDIVQLLLAKNIKFTSNSVGSTPLHLACEKGHFDIAKVLIKSVGLNIHAIDMLERSALHDAAIYGHFKIVKLLAENGLNINADDDDGKTPLHHSCLEGKLGVVKYLLSKGADVNALCFEGNTPLHYATEQGHVKIVKTLLETNGILTQVQNELCNTPRKLAEDHGDIKILKLFNDFNVF